MEEMKENSLLRYLIVISTLWHAWEHAFIDFAAASYHSPPSAH